MGTRPFISFCFKDDLYDTMKTELEAKAGPWILAAVSLRTLLVLRYCTAL